MNTLVRTPPHAMEGHVRRTDFSRWIREVFADVTLAPRVQAIEEQLAVGALNDFVGAIVDAIQERYSVDRTPD